MNSYAITKSRPDHGIGVLVAFTVGVLALTGCPTREVYYGDAGSDSKGGTAGTATGGSGSGGAGPGGASTGGMGTGGAGTGGTVATGGAATGGAGTGGMGTGGAATGGAGTGGSGTGGAATGGAGTGGMGTASGGAASGGMGTGGQGTGGGSSPCQKSATNVLVNPGFDGVSGWSIFEGASLAADSQTCPGSNSVKVEVTPTLAFGRFSQCIAVTAPTTYYFGFRYRQDAKTRLICRVAMHSSLDCSGDETFGISVEGAQIDTALPWTSSQPQGVMPSNGDRSAGVTCQTNFGVGYIDQLYLNTQNASF